jgi:multidrug efflux system membrane fusion protein
MTSSALRRGHAAARLSVALIIALALSACGSAGGEGDPGMQMPPQPVNVAAVVAREISEWDEFAGRIEAVDSVEIRPRVSGYLAAVHFSEGAEVAKGDLLFSIDDREYRAAAASARANLARAQTRRDVANQELARSEKLLAARAASVEEVEQRRGEVKQAEADVAAMRAALTQAELNIEFSRITAPIDGRIGAALIRPGNLLSAGQSLLTTLVSIDPVYVAFSGDERMYLKYQDLARDGLRASSRDARNPVRVGLSNEEGFPHQGEMVFVDNAIDPTTGTIRARALLQNADRIFTPGLFARVQLIGAAAHPALLIHDQAVLTDQDRKYVFVVGEGDTALRRDVVLGGKVDGLRIVESGLEPTDRVVVNGMKKIFFPGAPLQPIEVPMDAPNTIVAAPEGAAAPQG